MFSWQQLKDDYIILSVKRLTSKTLYLNVFQVHSPFYSYPPSPRGSASSPNSICFLRLACGPLLVVADESVHLKWGTQGGVCVTLIAPPPPPWSPSLFEVNSAPTPPALTANSSVFFLLLSFCTLVWTPRQKEKVHLTTEFNSKVNQEWNVGPPTPLSLSWLPVLWFFFFF